MKNQRFVIVPEFCHNCNQHGFKIIDTRGELKESSVFHSITDGYLAIKEILLQKENTIKYFMKKIVEDIIALQDAIIFLPLPPVTLVGKTSLQFAKECRDFYEHTFKYMETREIYARWLKTERSIEGMFLFTPPDFETSKNPWILILVPWWKTTSGYLSMFQRLESKKQARSFLEKAHKIDGVDEVEILEILSKVNNLERLPEMTEEEKIEERSQQN